jgi:hypothetical protein
LFFLLLFLLLLFLPLIHSVFLLLLPSLSMSPFVLMMKINLLVNLRILLYYLILSP